MFLNSRALGPDLSGGGGLLLTGLEWAIGQGYQIINMSLSTNKSQFVPQLRELVVCEGPGLDVWAG